MTEITAPLVRDLVDTPPRLPSPRAAVEDREPVTASQVRQRRWSKPLADVVGASVTVLGVQLIHPAAVSSLAMTLVLIVCWPTLLAGTGCYAAAPMPEPLTRRHGRVLRAGAILGLGCWVAFPLAGPIAAPAVLAPTVFALTAVGLLLSAVPARRTQCRVVVAGDVGHVHQCVSELSSAGSFDVAAVCSPTPVADLGDVRVHVGVEEALDVARECSAHALVILPGEAMPPEVLRRLEWQAGAAGVDVYVGTSLLDVHTARVAVVRGGGLDLLHLRPASLRGPRRLAKDVVERFAAVIGLLVMMPALLAVGALIRLDSAGPAIFRQTRVGRDGRTFTMYKFRTMTKLAEDERAGLLDDNECDAVLFKLRGDPRVTGIGAWLRRYSVDEVPQLLNVVLGDMSLVGPRPALPEEVESYDLDPRRRLAVKPGLTGLWQVSGRSDLTWAESVRLDVGYVDNWSLTMDVSILCRTFGAVLGHRGAY